MVLLFCYVLAGPGGGEAASSLICVIQVASVFVLVCSGEKFDCMLCAWAIQCVMCQRGECGSLCLLSSGQHRGNKQEKQKATWLLTYK